MPNVFLTADEHHFHKPINDLCARPFTSPEHATEEMVRRHNKVVRNSDDLTFHLGDWSFNRDPEVMADLLARLNGRHVLVSGNHDRASVTATNGWAHQRTYLVAGFEAVVDSATLALPAVSGKKMPDGIEVPARKVVLSHFPYSADHKDNPRYTQFRLRDEGTWLLHGHVHGLYRVRERGVNVGVDRWNYTPVNVHDVALLIAQVEAGVIAAD